MSAKPVSAPPVVLTEFERSLLQQHQIFRDQIREIVHGVIGMIKQQSASKLLVAGKTIHVYYNPNLKGFALYHGSCWNIVSTSPFNVCDWKFRQNVFEELEVALKEHFSTPNFETRVYTSSCWGWIMLFSASVRWNVPVVAAIT